VQGNERRLTRNDGIPRKGEIKNRGVSLKQNRLTHTVCGEKEGHMTKGMGRGNNGKKYLVSQAGRQSGLADRCSFKRSAGGGKRSKEENSKSHLGGRGGGTD